MITTIQLESMDALFAVGERENLAREKKEVYSLKITIHDGNGIAIATKQRGF